MHTNTPEYHKAFEAYMRWGTPIGLSLKKARTTTHYIWRTSGDNRVRDSHAANNGKIFSWDAPPPTGHPGDDYGCRCVAEPYQPELTEHFRITLSGVSDSGPAWTSRDFVHHYYNGGGRSVTLRQTGSLRAVVNAYRREVLDDPKRLPGQIADAARKSKGPRFVDDFDNTYGMEFVVFSLGDTTIKGNYSLNIYRINNALHIFGAIEFNHVDIFEDPINMDMEFVDVEDTFYENIYKPVQSRTRRRINRIISDRIRQQKNERLGIHTGTPYRISDAWSGRFEGLVFADRMMSRYRPDKDK